MNEPIRQEPTENEPVRGWKRRPRTAEGLKRDLLKVVIVGALFIALAVLVEKAAESGMLDVGEWRALLSSGEHAGGPLMGMLLFVLIGALLISAGLPRLFMAMIGGAIYGAWLGIVLSTFSALMGAVLLYVVGHRFLQKLVDRRIGGRLETWRARFREKAFWWVLYGRLFPFTNSTLNSLLCGSCDVPFWPYLTASFLGFLPQTIVFALFGSGGAKANLLQVGVAVLLLLLTIIAQSFLYRVLPSRNGRVEAAQSPGDK